MASRHRRQDEIQLYAFSILALGGVDRQRHALAALLRESPGTHCIGGCVVPKNVAPLGFEPPTVQSVSSRCTKHTIPAAKDNISEGKGKAFPL
jgi:hypothetical protein